MDIHKSLLISNSRFLPTEMDIDVNKFSEMYKYEEYLEEKTKKGLKNNLLKDIHTLNKELNPNKLDFCIKHMKIYISDEESLDLAFSELILRQHQKLAELKTKIEQKAQNFAKLCENRKRTYFESVFLF